MRDEKTISSRMACGMKWFFHPAWSTNHTTLISRIFHNFGFTGPICKIFTFLEMALKFVGSFSLVGRVDMKNKAATAKERVYFFNHIR